MIPLHDDTPTTIKPVFTVSFIVLCLLIFVWQWLLGPAVRDVIFGFGVIPAVLFGHQPQPPDLAVVPPWVTVFSSMFLHGGWMHLIGNMLYLWIFGNNIEDAMGHVRFVAFYLLCGVAAVFAQALPDTHSTVPMIGASGAISGILGAYILLYPRARVLVIIPIGFYLHTTRLPAMVVLGFWFVLQVVYSLLAAGQNAGVAWGAHISTGVQLVHDVDADLCWCVGGQYLGLF